MTLMSVWDGDDKVTLPEWRLNPGPKTHVLGMEGHGLGDAHGGLAGAWKHRGPYPGPALGKMGSLCPPGQRATAHLAGQGPGQWHGDSTVV